MWTAIFNGIGNGCENFFKILPAIGAYIDVLFLIIASIGTLYWIVYEIRVSKGGDNYLSKR